MAISSAAAQLSILLMSLIAARILGKERFGQFGMLQVTIGTFGVFAEMGLGLTSTKYVSAFRNLDVAKTARLIVLTTLLAAGVGTASAAALTVFAPLIAVKVLNAHLLSGAIRLVAPVILFNAISGASSGSLVGLEQFNLVTQANLLRSVLGVPLCWFLVGRFELRGALLSMVITAGMGALFNTWAAVHACRKAKIALRTWPKWSDFAVLGEFSLPAFFAVVMVTPVAWLTQAVLARQPDGYSAIAVITAASHWRYAVAFLPMVIAQSSLPILSNLYAENRGSDFRRVIQWQLLSTCGLSATAAAAVWFFSHRILLLYGPAFAGAESILALFAVVGLLTAVNNVAGAAIVSSGTIWWGLTFNALWAAVLIVAAYALVPRFSAMGLAVAYLVAYTAHTLWQGAFVLLKCGPRRLQAIEATL